MKMPCTLKVTWHIINNESMLWDTLSNASVILLFAFGITVFIYIMLKLCSVRVVIVNNNGGRCLTL